MKMADIRKLTTEDLNKKLEEIKKELFNLKFASATGNLEKPHRIKELRHDVAKIKTVIRERELNEGKEEVK
jgi:large subunit ribosomal protein L29